MPMEIHDDKIEQMPFGDTAASFAVWIRNGGEG
jgi:hypothetical protein